VQFSQDYLHRRLDQRRKEHRSGKLFLRVAALLMVLNALLVGLNLLRGWKTSDYLYTFILAIWTGCFFVQRKILAGRKEEVDRLTRELQKGGNGSAV
jgi:hypothetical protein